MMFGDLESHCCSFTLKSKFHDISAFFSPIFTISIIFTRAPITDSAQCESKNIQRATNSVLEFCEMYGTTQLPTSSNSIATALSSIQSKYPLLYRLVISMLHPEENKRPSIQDIKRSAYYLL